MDNGFSIWILTQRAEIFGWRNRDFWPEGFSIVVFEKLDLLLNNLLSRQPDFILLDWTEISQNAHPVAIRISRQSPLSEIYIMNLPENSPLPENPGRWELSGTYSKDLDDALLRKSVQEDADLKIVLNRSGMIGRSRHHKLVAAILQQIANTDTTVLVTGESGTGKEIIARAIHQSSSRRDKPFVSVNVAAIAESLLESELFGHERGAFTGADRQRAGYFESASGGSIFLDEIGEFKLDLQARLLRVLEQKTFYRLGGNQQIKTDMRVICATNRDLRELVEEGRFRNDLYYRLSVIQIATEPLRNRPEDIHPLAIYFLNELKADLGEIELLSEAVGLLVRYSWPGNVRELKNFIHSAAYLSANKKVGVHEVEEFIRKATAQNRSLPVVTGISGEQANFEMIYRALLSLARELAEMKEILIGNSGGRARHGEIIGDMEIKPELKSLADMEKEMIAKALEAASNNRKLAAKKLGIGERTLYRKIKEYGLN